MDNTTIILALSASVYKLVEVLKPAINNLVTGRLGWTVEAYSAVVQGVAILLGIASAFVAGNVNMLPASLPVNATVGVIVTGIVIGMGSDIVNAVLDFLNSWQRPVTTTISSSATLTTSETAPAEKVA